MRRKQYEWIPGLSEAARTLQISYGHARRVWIGEREAPETLKRLRELIGPRPRNFPQADKPTNQRDPDETTRQQKT